MDVKARHALVHGPDNGPASVGLLSSGQGSLPGQDEPQHDQQRSQVSRAPCAMEDTLLTTPREESTHGQSPSNNVCLVPVARCDVLQWPPSRGHLHCYAWKHWLIKGYCIHSFDTSKAC